MSEQMRLSAFSMNCVGHQAQGMWRHPRDRSADYTSLEHWTDVARTLERGRFDLFFLADVLGVYDVYGAGPDAALRNAAQVPANDPLMVVPAMAAVTEHLGFGVTAITSFEPPYTFARRMSTLDHLTRGRISWNIVTGYLDSASKAMGQSGLVDHDRRYEMAEEYLEVVYRLWEASWDDDAVQRDRERGVYVDPRKVRPISHHGTYYDVEGIHLCEPSPQRTPVIFQAGASPAGQQFAASHAECVFLGGANPSHQRRSVEQLRELVRAHGREPTDVHVFAMVTVVVDETDGAAARKLDDYRAHVSPEGALVLLSGWSGIDYSQPPPDRAPGNAIAVPAIPAADLDARAAQVGLAGSAPLLVGSPTTIADELEAWMADTGVDGFNLTRQVVPESYVDFVDLVVPELQRRGVHKREYADGTLREKLSGTARLRAPHPAASTRTGRHPTR